MKNQYPALTPTQEDYLSTIFRLALKTGEARSKEIASTIGVSKSTVPAALKCLAVRKLIIYEPYSPIRLTPEGHEIGKRIAHRNFVLHKFFIEILRLPEHEAKQTACRVEHAVSDDTVIELGRFIFFLMKSGADLENWKAKYEMPQTHASVTKPLSRL